MTQIALRMSANLLVEVGMRVFYDSPSMSTEDHKSDQFFRKYSGKMATIVGFGVEYVGILDTSGRKPGVYHKSSVINVRFDGEDAVHTNLNLWHFVLDSPTTTVAFDEPLNAQWVGDLPHPILFCPGDVVRKTNDLLQVERIVRGVSIGSDGVPYYMLSETEDDRKAREADVEAANKEAREAGRMSFGSLFSHPRTEQCFGEELVAMTRGNLYWLYSDTSQMQFSSDEEKVRFWSQDGLSKTVYSGRGIHLRYEYPLSDALAMVKSGEGDIVIRNREYKNVIVSGRSGDHQVRMIHSCFEPFREEIRKIVLRKKKALPEERTASDSMRSLSKMMTSW